MDTILFLCPHNAAKGIMAEAYFNQQVRQKGLPFLADSAGTEPSEHIWPAVLELLQAERIPLTSRLPRKVTREDILRAFQVISLGCAIEEFEEVPRQFILWEDVPLASTNLYLSWTAIRHHVDQLITDLARSIELAQTAAPPTLMDRQIP